MEATIQHGDTLRRLPAINLRMAEACSSDMEAASESRAWLNKAATVPVVGCMARAALSGAEVMGAAWADVKEKTGKEKAAAAANTLGIIAVEVVGVLHLPSVLALPLAIGVSKTTGISPLEGVLVGSVLSGAAYGGWTYTAASSLNGGINRLPGATEAVHKNLPATECLSDVLPGLRASGELETTGKKFRTRLARGWSVYGTGVLPYAMASGAQNQSRPERRKLSRNLGIDAAMFMGFLALGVTGSTALFEKPYPDFTEQVLNTAGDTGLMFKLTWGMAATRVAIKAACHQIKKRKNLRHSRLQPTLELDAV